MTTLPPSKQYAQTEATTTRNPVSESLVQTVAGTANALLDNTLFVEEWKLNGPIKTFNGQLGVDGIFSVPITSLNWEIVDVSVYGGTMGTGSYVEFDVQHAAYGSTSFTSIFSTKPQIFNTAGNYVTAHEGDSVSGVTSPVLITNPYPLAAKDKLRFDVTNMQTGSPRNFGLRVYYRMRN